MSRALVLALVMVVSGLLPATVLGDGLAQRYEAALALRRARPADFGPSPGVFVIRVEPDSPAAALGIRAGDIWIGYQGLPIVGVQSFLDRRAEPDSSGELLFLRDGALTTLALPAGRLGAGLLELAEHGLDAADAEILFNLLEIGYAGDQDRLMAFVREQADQLETLRQQLARAGQTDQPGAAHLRQWADSLASFLELGRRLAGSEAKLDALQAEVIRNEQELARVRTARYNLEFQALAQQSQAAEQAGQQALAAKQARAAQALARNWAADLPAVATALQQALPMVLEAHALNRLAEVLARSGEHEEVLRAAEAALARVRAGAALARTVTARDDLAQRNELLALATRTEDLSLDLLALSQDLLGHGPAAQDVSRERLRRAEAAGDIASRIRAHMAQGMMLMDAGDYVAAHGQLSAALTLLQEQPDPHQATQVQAALSTLFMQLGDAWAAVAHGEQALAASGLLPHREPGNGDDSGELAGWSVERELMAHVELGFLQSVWLGNLKAGRDHYQQAAALADQFLPEGDPRRGIALTGLAFSDVLAGDLDGALTNALESLTLARRDPRREMMGADARGGEAYGAALVAEVLVSRREFERAEEFLRQAEAAAPADEPQLLLGVQETRARARLLAGDPAAAEALLRENLAPLEQLRRAATDTEQARIAVADLFSTNFDLLQDVLLAQGRDEDALVLLEERRGQTLFDQADGGAGWDLARMRALAAGTGATLVFYAVDFDVARPLLPGRLLGNQPDAEQGLLIWVMRPDGQVRLRRQPIRFPDPKIGGLGEGLWELRARLRPDASGQTPNDPDPLLRGFHDLLIAPIADLLPPAGGHLVFVPDGPLLLLPFAALRDADGHYLVERHPVVVLPSLKLLGRTAAREAGQGDGALIVGGPAPVDHELMATFKDLARPLPKAPEEARLIGAVLHAQPLLGETATRQAVLERMSGARWLHFATHALASRARVIARTAHLAGDGVGEPPGALVLASGGADLGLLTAGEIMRQPLTAELAVLSACNTGQGQLTSDGVWGLPYAFVRAGVPRVVVSLWGVDDDSAAVLMPHFYRGAAEGASLAEALRQAMLHTIANGHPHPRQWAAFILMGRW